MLTRIGLAILASVLAFQAMLLCEQWVPQPLVAITSDSGFSLLGWVVAIATVVMAVITLTLLVTMVIWLFSPKVKYVSHEFILWTGVVLIISAACFGAFMEPTVRYGSLEEWFFTYPESLLAWATIGPLALIFLNFVREIYVAIKEYERRAREETDPLSEVQTQLSSINSGVASIARNVVKSLDETEKLIGTIGKEVSALNSSVTEHLEDDRAKLRKQLDGISQVLRGMQEAARKPQTPLAPAPSVEFGLEGEPVARIRSA